MKRIKERLALWPFIIIGLIIYLLTSCSKDEGTLNGCQTGIPIGETQRELIRCCTKAQALAGNNVAQGGIARFTNYTQVTWEKCDQCK